MYLQTFGGSALLHLLASHPRVVALFGIAATAGLLIAPHAPGRLLGTATRIERIEAAIRPQAALTEERQIAAERAAALLLERQAKADIAAAVKQTLKRCGSGCTDISTESVISDELLLERVLVLYELDKMARGPREEPLANRLLTPVAVAADAGRPHSR
jgi:hypothetical protein